MILLSDMNANKMITSLLFVIVNCVNAQNDGILPLEEAFKYYNSVNGFPKGTRYIKDTKKQLDKFVGIWKGKFEGKTYEFRFEKKKNFGDYTIKWDKLIGEVMVKNNKGKIIYSNLSKNIKLNGIAFQHQVYMLNFIANSQCLDKGIIYIEIKKDNPNQMRLDFSRDTGMYNPAKCPDFETYETTLPNRKVIILTKQ